ncbi:helix-turn-helix domain-containing protein [Bradyrhizobium sp. 1]|uniref:helix-turn-helix domain-containing protein n=1 Tax=Bradyrhizobium sp. 1 TaxID=241591 RepID=UPI003211BF00
MIWRWRTAETANSRNEETGMVKKAVAKKKKAVRSLARLTTLDDFLVEDGNREEFEAIAVKEVLAWQIEQAMKENNISRNNLAQRMKTSRSQIGRLLDPKDGNVTLATLQRAARMVGRSLRLELV